MSLVVALEYPVRLILFLFLLLDIRHPAGVLHLADFISRSFYPHDCLFLTPIVLHGPWAKATGRKGCQVAD